MSICEGFYQRKFFILEVYFKLSRYRGKNISWYSRLDIFIFKNSKIKSNITKSTVIFVIMIFKIFE